MSIEDRTKYLKQVTRDLHGDEFAKEVIDLFCPERVLANSEKAAVGQEREDWFDVTAEAQPGGCWFDVTPEDLPH